MGADHPLAWWHCVGKGHVFYSALGHGASMYSEGTDHFSFYSNAIAWGLAGERASRARGEVKRFDTHRTCLRSGSTECAVK